VPPASDASLWHNGSKVTSPTPAFLELRDAAMSCTACRLAETRTSVVFGVGDPDARLMLVGEAPGKNEDLQGEPFVGAAGHLLDELMEAIGISRSEAYIANVLKCRPPGNRDPQQDEIDSCKGFLREQIRMIHPEVVMTLGNFATKLLVPTEIGITRMRGQRINWWLGATLVPTFHPAAALRGGPRVREQMEEDFALVRSILDGEDSDQPATESEPMQQSLGLER
jgi:uracil-DNA glycosylase family 4